MTGKSRWFICLLGGVLLAVNNAICTHNPAVAEDKSPQAKSAASAPSASKDGATVADPGKMPDSYWKKKLDPKVYQVTRCSATEAPFTGKYWDNHQHGTYKCSNCGAVLFESNDKFDSGTGWPSFTRAQQNSVGTKQDRSAGMVREEVICKKCGAHLGHLFDDGPAPTKQRYCINSASLDFKKQPDGK